MYHARSVVAAAQTKSGELLEEFEGLNQETPETILWAENWYDGLTYCK